MNKNKNEQELKTNKFYKSVVQRSAYSQYYPTVDLKN